MFSRASPAGMSWTLNESARLSATPSYGSAQTNRWTRRSESVSLTVYFITVDPERDTPEKLKDYLSSFDPHLTALTGSPEAIAAELTRAGIADAPSVAGQLIAFARSRRYAALSAGCRSKVDALLPLLIEAASAEGGAAATALRLLRLIEAIDRREAYLSLLVEFPAVLRRAARQDVHDLVVVLHVGNTARGDFGIACIAAGLAIIAFTAWRDSRAGARDLPTPTPLDGG